MKNSTSKTRKPVNRELRAYLQLPNYDLQPLEGDLWTVAKREGQPEPYVVDVATGACTCEDSKRGHVCKHFRMVNLVLISETPAPSPRALDLAARIAVAKQATAADYPAALW